MILPRSRNSEAKKSLLLFCLILLLMLPLRPQEPKKLRLVWEYTYEDEFLPEFIGFNIYAKTRVEDEFELLEENVRGEEWHFIADREMMFFGVTATNTFTGLESDFATTKK